MVKYCKTFMPLSDLCIKHDHYVVIKHFRKKTLLSRTIKHNCVILWTLYEKKKMGRLINITNLAMNRQNIDTIYIMAFKSLAMVKCTYISFVA